MGVIKKKPYELSIWEDRLVKENDISYYKEIKIAVIGSDRMESPNRAFDVVLTENVNGEKTLSFSIAYKYFDETSGERVNNPFYPYLINERKLKLFYDNEWFEFLIKECDESSEDYIFKYTAKELFSLELAKLGYNVTLDTSLNNNQGSVIELAKKVLEDTDWEVDEDNSDLLVQKVQEPLYNATLLNSIEVLNLDTNQLVTLEADSEIYIFYSYINEQIKDNVQFILKTDNFEYDDDNVIIATNYRIQDSVEYIIENEQIEIKNIASVGNLYLAHQGYRLVYNIRTVYDPVMDRTVELYQIKYDDSTQDIYHYLDYNYTTSDVVMSYITNGSDFNILSNGSLQGWDNNTDTSGDELQLIELTTYPEISPTSKLISTKDLSEVNGYLELKFNGLLDANYKNTYYNSGFEDNSSIIDHISAGERFVLRVRYCTSDTQHGDLVAGAPQTSSEGLRVVIAKYERIKGEENYYKKILPDEIVLDFNQEFHQSLNIIDNGIFNNTHTQYIVNNVIQTPSTAYTYITKDDSTQYIWSPKSQKYIEKDSLESDVVFADYYYTIARAQQSFSNEILSDPKFKLGIFLYTKDSNLLDKYIYLQDIQLTRYYETKDVEGNPVPVIIGNIPTAVSNQVDCFYLKPENGAKNIEINTYESLSFLATELGVNRDLIRPVYNENSEKILSITAANSNYFNILQDLCETFECWLDIRVAHEKDGTIALDSQKNPIKKVAFKAYAGKDNFAGFKNGINLSSIQRQIDSNEIVSKLIVEPVQSEYSDTGSIDIQRASSNPSKQSYIINFSYFLNMGLITDREECNNDLNNYYQQLSELNKQIDSLEKEFIYLQNSILKITSNRNTFTTLVETAQDTYNKALQEFYEMTNCTYEDFVNKYQNIEGWAVSPENKDKDYLNNDSVVDRIGEIYASVTTINNYSGLLANLDEEYRQLDLKCYGAKEYGISVVSIPRVTGEESINPSTQVVIDNYTTDIEFKLIDENGGEVIRHSSPNDRIFNVSNETSYEYIVFTQIPSNYKLRYYENNKSIELDTEQAKMTKFKIVDSDENKTLNRRFVLIPTEEYAEQYLGYEKQIDKLIKDKQIIEKNFYKKYSRFLQEGTWSSQDYINPELYYLDALQVSNTSAQPKVSYTINVLEVSQLDGLQNYDFRVGDKTYIEDIDFFGYIYETYESIDEPIQTPIREEVIVSEVEWHLDEPDNNTITIQNYKTRFEDLFQRISASVQTVQRNEITYPKTTSILDQSGLINSTLLANSLEGIGGTGFALTSNGSIATTNDGLIVRDLLTSANLMKLTSTGLQISTDGGNSWNTAVNAAGISADVLNAGTINTQKIWLMDGNNPSFRWDKAGLSAYGLDESGNEAYDLKTYVRFDKYGLYGIKNDENYVANSLSDVRNKAFFGITWDGFFIKNSYVDGGEVSITSEEDIVVKGSNGNKRIWIGAVQKDNRGAPTKYGINIMNDNGDVVFDTGDDGNITMTGTINAQAGMFTGAVNVGNPNSTHIIINGETDNPVIQSSNYSEDAETGWIIDSKGDATFSNVSVRGAIKTAVFEYEEIQAVGGAFLFRPSSTIKTVRYEPVDNPIEETDENGDNYTIDYYNYENGNKIYRDLIVTVEKPLMFREHNWVKLSNYNAPTSDLNSYGLVHIYEVSAIDSTIHPGETVTRIGEDGLEYEVTLPSTEPSYEITLAGGCAILDDINIRNIPGGALIDFGSHAQEGGIDVPGEHNYGIGINSSDNYVNLPARAISLFETTIHPNDTTKVTYNYRGILGTLPHMSSEDVGIIYPTYMQGKQGIYTDNIYIGNAEKYIAFYKYTEINPETQLPEEKANLRVVADQFIVSADDSDLVDIVNNSVYETAIEYCLSASTLTNTHGTVWMNIMPSSTEQNPYLWQRTKITYNNGAIKYLPDDGGVGDGFYVETSEGGTPGEDAVTLTIQSSNGEVFRTTSDTSVLTVIIFKGTNEITTQNQLDSIYGQNQVSLQWSWKNAGDNNFTPVPAALLDDDGFTFEIDGSMISLNKIFQCELVYNEGE